MHISNLHLEIFDKTRLALFTELPPYVKEFYLSGGTSLALQIGHRESYDFDFFSFKPISTRLIEKLSKHIPIQRVSIDTADELTFFTKTDIKLTFLNYPFPISYDLIKLENGIQIASVDEISVQKAYTVGRRGEFRDYFDIYTILQRKLMTLDTIIQAAEKKYKELFNSKLFLEQLVYFDDLLNFNIIPVDKAPSPDPLQIKSFFEQEVKTYINK